MLTAVKPPVLTAVNPAGAELCVMGIGLDAPFSSLCDRGVSCVLADSGAIPGAGEKRWACAGISGMFSILPGPAGYSDLSDFLGLPFRLRGMVLYGRLTGVEPISSSSDIVKWALLLRFFRLIGLTSRSIPAAVSGSGGVSDCGVPWGDCISLTCRQGKTVAISFRSDDIPGPHHPCRRAGHTHSHPTASLASCCGCSSRL